MKMQVVLVVSVKGAKHDLVSTHGDMMSMFWKYKDDLAIEFMSMDEIIESCHELLTVGIQEADNGDITSRIEFWDDETQNPISFSDDEVRRAFYQADIDRIQNKPEFEVEMYEPFLHDGLVKALKEVY